MSLFVAAALLASAAATTVPECSWDKPGVHPFMGNVVASVDRYTDIAPDVRARLQKRMAARQYDELVTIRRDAIVGKQRYEPEIRDMHFGSGQVCRTVTRTNWTADNQERGLVYCDSGQCLLVPTVCRNLSRITRLDVADNAVSRGPVPPGPRLGPPESADGSAGAFGGGGSALGGDTGLGQTGSVIGSVEGVGGPLLVQPPTAVGYPTVQGPVGGITIFQPGLPAVPAVPEVPAMWLWLLGGAGVVGAARWRRRRSRPEMQAAPIP